MKKLINTGRTPLGIPGKKLLDPGDSLLVEDDEIESICKNKIVLAWVNSGILEIDDGESGAYADEDESDEDESDEDESDEKARLVAELAGFGITKTVKTSLVNLRAALEQAKATAGKG